MVMEPRHDDFSDYIDGFTLDDASILPIFDQSPGIVNGYRFKDEPLDLSFLELPKPSQDPVLGTSNVSSDMSSLVDSPDEFADCVFKYLNQILVEEEEMEGKQSMFHDPLALQATERSLYEALGEKYPPPPSLPPPPGGPEESFFRSSSDYSTNSSNSTDPHWPGADSLDTKSLEYLPLWSFNDANGTMDSAVNAHVAQNIFTNSESILQFQRGMEEASRFLPPSRPLVIDLDAYDLPSDSKDAPLEAAVVKAEKVEAGHSDVKFTGRKHYQLEDEGYEEERSSKQSAVYVEEAELSEMFDRVLLCTDAKDASMSCEQHPTHLDTRPPKNGWNPRTRNRESTNDVVDVRTLLVNCAHAVAADDRRTAYEQLKQIQRHASPSGDASQRLAHIFSMGLEARLAGTGSQLYEAKRAMRISAAEKLKAYQVYLSACPFKKIAIFFANKTIYEASLTSSILHIVDFGIAYGFQWPVLIKHLSERPGGPPKLRITGIELPQPGFRPAERVEETGRRLANYCERFKVPFEYNAIATQNWETVRIEELKLQRHEFLAVNTLMGFKNLLDETVLVDNPRDGVLKLIRDMKPDIFVQAVVNGSYSAPFFVTRFREALFHYSALFDMFDATLDRDNEQRSNFEREFCGREAMNVIACEGAERVERPETYKQWQARNSRAGFKIRPLNQELVSKLRCKVKAGYHKDFVYDEDGKWILQGWKGRILYASSSWVPA